MTRSVLIAVVLAGSAMAQQAPVAPTLSYSGFLEDSGVPVTGPRLIGISMFAQAAAGTVLCQIPQAQVEVSNGHFHVPLNDATCDAAIKANPEVFVEVRIGTVVMPRTRIGAVPYALSAWRSTPARAARSACTTIPWSIQGTHTITSSRRSSRRARSSRPGVLRRRGTSRPRGSALLR